MAVVVVMTYFLLLCVVVGGSGSRPYFIASRSHKERDIGNFAVQLNRRFRVLFDTGSFFSWVKSSTLADGGYDIAGRRMIQVASNFDYPFCGNVQSEYAVEEHFMLDTIKWKQVMPIVTSGAEWLRLSVGIIGASLNTPFARAMKVFTSVPYPDHFRIYPGPMELSGNSCFAAPLTELGLRASKWIISGSIKIGNSPYRVTEFEVDTGFTSLALSNNMWEAFKRRMGTKRAWYSASESNRSHHVFHNCFADSIPTITYKIGLGRTITIASSSYVRFFYNSVCVVNVEPHNTRKFIENVSYIGVPVLSGAIVQFNSETQSITFCEDKNVNY